MRMVIADCARQLPWGWHYFLCCWMQLLRECFSFAQSLCTSLPFPADYNTSQYQGEEVNVKLLFNPTQCFHKVTIVMCGYGRVGETTGLFVELHWRVCQNGSLHCSIYISVPEWIPSLQYTSVPEWLPSLQYISVPEWLPSLQYISVPEWLPSLPYISVPEWLPSLQCISVPEWLASLQYISVPEWLH